MRRHALLVTLLGVAGCTSGGGSHFFAGSTAAPATSASPSPSTPTTSTAPSAAATLLGDPLSPANALGPVIRDALGRQVLLRGINLSERAKKPPFAGWLTPAHVEHIVRLGFDHVRFLITWGPSSPRMGSSMTPTSPR